MPLRLIAWLFIGALAVSAWAAESNRRLQPGEGLEGRFVQEKQLRGFTRPIKSAGRFSFIPGG